MTLIAKRTIKERPDDLPQESIMDQRLNESVELFETETHKDIDGNDVLIPKSIGTFTLAVLERDKAALLAQIALIEKRIAAINESF